MLMDANVWLVERVNVKKESAPVKLTWRQKSAQNVSQGNAPAKRKLYQMLKQQLNANQENALVKHKNRLAGEFLN